MAYTTIDDPEAYFQTVLWTGNGSARSITLDGDTDMQPDFVWIKRRNSARNSALLDAVRGGTEQLISNSTAAEATDAQLITAFDSDGFSLGTSNDCNSDTDTFVAWCWKESATAGFDIVLYTGDGSNRTISHSLSAVPKFFMIKNRSSTHAWRGYHASLGADKNISWEMTAAEQTGTNYWQDTAPTDSVFSLGDQNETNQSTYTFVNYLWSEKQGFSKFGFYTGNGNVDGTFIYTGFRPAFLMVKASSATSAWYIYDNKRAGYNVENYQLYPDRNNAEDTTDQIDLLSNGFKWRAITGDPNSSGRTYIYMAFAEAPFVNSNGVPCNAR